ncbi:MAG: hypothetical protein U9N45_05560, partial [Gemmatimonadota bacterium]|nr:hypothetical protein [Gemmatimonadota bacterium]
CCAANLMGQEKTLTKSEREGAKIFNQASEAFAAGEYEKAIPHFLSADSLIGESGLVDRLKLRYALGVSCLKTGRPDKALLFFEWVAIEDTSYPYIHFQAAESAFLSGKKTLALTFYRKALPSAKKAERPVILYKIGRLLFERGHFKGALESCNQAIALSRAANFYLFRGKIFDRLAQRIDHAETEDFNFEQAIRDGTLTEEKILEAVELRRKALADYEAAAQDKKLSNTAKKLIERSAVILENNQQIISEIHYLRENP